jgi:sugar lactone lactonase YvrE
MKNRLNLVFSIFAVLSLMLSGAAANAQRPEPEAPRPDLQPVYRQPRSAYLPDPDSPWDLVNHSSSLGLASRQTPQVTPGAPGLAFRFERIFGVTEEPYLTDGAHLNGPEGIFIDGSNNLYVAEQEGARVLRYDAAGGNTLILGKPGRHSTEDYRMSWPNDVFADSSGDIWIVDNNRVTRYSGGGSIEMVFPGYDQGPWDCGTDNGHFCTPYGIAFDSAGRLYISDMDNHRVQVFTISAGTPVYSTTIGVSGVYGNDNQHFYWPAHIAIDAGDHLYVADSENNRIQKCSYAAGWTCSTFHGTGSSGSGVNELSYPYGVAVSGSNVYIADSDNYRVKSCNSTGTICNVILDDTQIVDPRDVALDSFGNLYVSEWNNVYRVSKYSSGALSTFAGTFGIPYLTDPGRMYNPYGIAIDSSGNLYIPEQRGNRYVKLNSNGAQVWAKGQAGIRANDADHFGDNLIGNPAISANNLLYLPAGNLHCVRVYNLDGVYQNASIGTCGTRGDSSILFAAVAGVAISPINGDIYVVDRNNNKVKIYTGNRAYKTTLGIGLGSIGQGNGNYQFDQPYAIAIDKTGVIYVADRNNHRVQVYNSSGIYQRTIGQVDVCDFGNDYLCSPSSVAVDDQRRVYIAESGNNRLQVFDAAGAYLTTLGGASGANTSDFRSPSGVAVDKLGNVYVTEQNNQRITKFAPGVTGWQQTNLNGFADRGNWLILALEPFGDFLYAAPLNNETPAQLWRKSSTTNWSAVTQNGFGNSHTGGVDDMAEFKGQLYASTWTDQFGGEILRSSAGLDWTRVVTGGFGDKTNSEIFSMIVFSNTLYATTWSYTTTHGAEIWRSSSGDKGSWSRVVSNGFGDPNNQAVIASEVYSNSLYLGTNNWNNASGTTTGGKIWRSGNGVDWTPVNSPGFGDVNNSCISSLEPFNGYLYASTVYSGTLGGAQVWRCHVCNGSDWNKVVDNGLGSATRDNGNALMEFEGWLYWIVPDYFTSWTLAGEGIEVWRSRDGLSWHLVSLAGFGDGNNRQIYWSNSVAAYRNDLFIGTRNSANGSEIWMYLERIYLPIIRR